MRYEVRFLFGSTASHWDIDNQIKFVLSQIVLDALLLTFNTIFFKWPVNNLNLKNKGFVNNNVVMWGYL